MIGRQRKQTDNNREVNGDEIKKNFRLKYGFIAF